MSLGPYASLTQILRTKNDEDPFFSMDSEDGFNPIFIVVLIQHHDVAQGMIGYITLGIDARLILGMVVIEFLFDIPLALALLARLNLHYQIFMDWVYLNLEVLCELRHRAI